jgi:predicted amidohydrolase
MKAELGDVEANLKKAEKLVLEAFAKGAQWVILPEFFASSMAVHHKMLDAARPLDGKPTQLLKRLAKENRGVVGGSFLATRNGHTYNTFVLAFPDGKTFFHDKDYPTFLENNYYLGGTDDGVFNTPRGKVGAALCWEFVRAGTARRMQDKVDLVVGGACWWGPRDDLDTPEVKKEREDNLNVIKETPVKFARMLGVPVVFAQQAGNYQAFEEPDEKQPYNSHFIGQTMIVDGHGWILARMSYEDGEGVIVADVKLGKVSGPLDPIPAGFWIPDMSGLNGGTKEGWEKTLVPGRKYYDTVTYPHRQKHR